MSYLPQEEETVCQIPGRRMLDVYQVGSFTGRASHFSLGKRGQGLLSQVGPGRQCGGPGEGQGLGGWGVRPEFRWKPLLSP